MEILNYEEDNNKENKENKYVNIFISRRLVNTIIILLLLFLDSLPKTDKKITRREREILELVAKGLDNQRIANKLGVSIHTVKIHLLNVFLKLEVGDRTHAVVKAIKYRLIDVFNE